MSTHSGGGGGGDGADGGGAAPGGRHTDRSPIVSCCVMPMATMRTVTYEMMAGSVIGPNGPS